MVTLSSLDMTGFTYRDWIAYFTENDMRRLTVDFTDDITLSDEKKKLVFPSIRAFQRGEGSDGRHLLKTVDATRDPDYRRAMELFIKEENFHSAYLRQYMEHYGVPPQTRSFLDRVFRRLRRIGGLRCEITVLVTAEMIALSYYSALAECTPSPTLRRICAQMLTDELPHIVFQSYTLGHFKNGFFFRAVRRAVMDTTSLFVWCAFSRVFRRGGYNFHRFIKENHGYLSQSDKIAAICKNRSFPKKPS